MAVLPGTAFGPRSAGYLRLCFANSGENIERAEVVKKDKGRGEG